jgi:hypothetical protein
MEVPVPSLPERPNLEHLKKQAKDLLRFYQPEIQMLSAGSGPHFRQLKTKTMML